MLILMDAHATPEDVAAVEKQIRDLGFQPNDIPGATRLCSGITGNQGPIDPGIFTVMKGVADAVPVSKAWKLVSREVKPDDTFVRIGAAQIGGGRFGVIAGPCAVESREQIDTAARAVKAAGAHFLRGGAFKPRTSPYVFQVGARNMQNFSLLEAVGSQPKPVMLKRGLSATIQEFLMAAEYIVKQGNYNVILCERGIRTFETMTRNTMDLGSIPVIKRLTHLPIIVDPSHGTGDWKSLPAMARAAVAVGADGLMVEVHPNPSKALSDGPQSLTPEMFAELMVSLRAIAGVVGLTL